MSDIKPLVKVLRQWHKPNESISFRAMPVMMDIHSGLGTEYRSMIEEQSKTGLLGQFLNDILPIGGSARI